jgi:Fe-S-cluster-containing hydrogenase component 2
MAQMLYASQQKGFRCGTCPIACTLRCIQIYRSRIPKASLEDFSNVIFCTWVVSQFDNHRVPVNQFAGRLTRPDFPDLLNSVPGKDLEHGSSLGKYCKLLSLT